VIAGLEQRCDDIEMMAVVVDDEDRAAVVPRWRTVVARARDAYRRRLRPTLPRKRIRR
jgi:hypothetical protein